MTLLDFFKNTHIPFISNDDSLVLQENRLVRYYNEEHEYIDSLNFFDIVTVG